MRVFPYILPVVLALLAGCEREPLSSSAGEGTGSPILFSAPDVSVHTKTGSEVPADSTVLVDFNKHVSVFGIWEEVINLNPISIFTNEELTCDDVLDIDNDGNLDHNHSVWNYTPLKYWKDNGIYCFAAVFPYNPSSAEIYKDDMYHLTVVHQASKNCDLMVARASRKPADQGKNPVPLYFNHATAAVRFLFSKASSDASDHYYLTSFSLDNVVANGSLRVDAHLVGDNPAITLGQWTDGVVTTVHSWSADSSDPTTRKEVPYPANTSDPDDYLQMGWYYMIPQNLSTDVTLRYSVAYNDEAPITSEVNFYGVLNQLDVAGVSWNPNYVYNYYVDLSRSGVNITVRTVPWDEVQVTTDDIIFE